MCKQVTIGFGFTSYWIKRWGEQFLSQSLSVVIHKPRKCEWNYFWHPSGNRHNNNNNHLFVLTIYKIITIIVKFVRRITKDKFYKARRKLNDLSTKDLGSPIAQRIFIAESLTQKNKELFKEAYQAHTRKGVLFHTHFRQLCTSILGSIVVSIPACHAGDPGSIPHRGEIFSFVIPPYFSSVVGTDELASIGVIKRLSRYLPW